MRFHYSGILPAMQCPFLDDFSIDEPELRRFARWLISHDGVTGLVTNGHTGEVFALSAEERARVTAVVADAVEGRVPVVSGICCEGIHEAIEHARLAAKAGASALMIMPPHHWLRFGMRADHVIEYFQTLGDTTALDLIVHVYPAWTKASYSEAVLGELARITNVRAFKLGTRDMSKYARDIRAIRAAKSDTAILTCHDEYLLASMIQGVDGALVGFASFIPDLVTRLFRAVQRYDLREAMELQHRIDTLKDAVYGAGEPTGDAHARMKAAMVLTGRLRSATVQPPLKPPTDEELEAIRSALDAAGMEVVTSVPSLFA